MIIMIFVNNNSCKNDNNDNNDSLNKYNLEGMFSM